VAAENTLIDISMSDLATFKTCRKKFDFSFVRGWYARTASKPMLIGTAYHAKLAEGYRAVQAFDRTTPYGAAHNLRAVTFLEAAVAHEPDVDRDGRSLGLDQGDYELLEDMVRYWFQEIGEADLREIEEILAVEVPHFITIGPYRVRCTLDAVVRRVGETFPSVVDHKTGDPQTAPGWIYLDTQTSTYYVMARGTYGGVAQFRHQWQDRDVPPGFGHRSLLTDTGKERSKATLASMQRPEKYVSVVKTELNDAQVDAYTAELIDIIQEIDLCKTTGRYLRREPIKVGPMKCESCAYFQPCQAERMGQPPMDESLAAMNYIVRGSAEWKAWHEGQIVLDTRNE